MSDFTKAKKSEDVLRDKVYVPTGKENEFIKAYVYYDLGGTSWDMKPSKRGIWIIVTPIERDGRWERTGAYQGFKHCLKELKRKSPREINLAEEWFVENGKAIAEAFNKGDQVGIWERLDSYGKDSKVKDEK